MDVLVVVQRATSSRATSAVLVDDAMDLHEGSCGRGGDGLHGTDVRLHDVQVVQVEADAASAKRARCVVGRRGESTCSSLDGNESVRRHVG